MCPFPRKKNLPAGLVAGVVAAVFVYNNLSPLTAGVAGGISVAAGVAAAKISSLAAGTAAVAGVAAGAPVPKMSSEAAGAPPPKKSSLPPLLLSVFDSVA